MARVTVNALTIQNWSKNPAIRSHFPVFQRVYAETRAVNSSLRQRPSGCGGCKKSDSSHARSVLINDTLRVLATLSAGELKTFLGLVHLTAFTVTCVDAGKRVTVERRASET